MVGIVAGIRYSGECGSSCPYTPLWHSLSRAWACTAERNPCYRLKVGATIQGVEPRSREFPSQPTNEAARGRYLYRTRPSSGLGAATAITARTRTGTYSSSSLPRVTSRSLGVTAVVSRSDTMSATKRFKVDSGYTVSGNGRRGKRCRQCVHA